MDLVSYLDWLYRQDLVKIHHGQLPFLGLRVIRILENHGIKITHTSRTTGDIDLFKLSSREECRCSRINTRIYLAPIPQQNGSAGSIMSVDSQHTKARPLITGSI